MAVRLHAGDALSLAFVRDEDGDKLFARTEFLHGASDIAADTDDDGLDDWTEIVDGWTVVLRGQPAYAVWPRPDSADSDGDGLPDAAEHACRTDPLRADSDVDGIDDWEEFAGYAVYELDEFRFDVEAYRNAPGTLHILDGGDGRAGGGNGFAYSPAGDDALVEAASMAGPGRHATIDPGANGQVDTAVHGDDFLAAAHDSFSGNLACAEALAALIEGRAPDQVLYATHPLAADSDGDGFGDGTEIRFQKHPNNRQDGYFLTDTDQDGLVDAYEDIAEEDITGYTIVVNGASRRVRPRHDVADSDRDGLPDLLEFHLGSDPTLKDTDGDGLEDADELDINRLCLPSRQPSKADPCGADYFDRAQFEAECSRAPACRVNLDDFNGHGSNLNRRDSDLDGLDDQTELSGWTISVRDIHGQVAQPHVSSDPRLPDSDGDGLDDGQERRGDHNRILVLEVPIFGSQTYRKDNTPSDPRAKDTDGDGVDDFAETSADPVARWWGFYVGRFSSERGGAWRSPARADVHVKVRYDRWTVGADACDDGISDVTGEFSWDLGVKLPQSENQIDLWSKGKQNVREKGELPYSEESQSFEMFIDAGQSLEFHGTVTEHDGDSGNEHARLQGDKAIDGSVDFIVQGNLDVIKRDLTQQAPDNTDDGCMNDDRVFISGSSIPVPVSN